LGESRTAPKETVSNLFPRLLARYEKGPASTIAATTEMSRQIKCECGFVARGETDDEVVHLIEGHIRSDHPELVDTLTRDEIASWVEVVE
jgi:predicted small metal-binding protein